MNDSIFGAKDFLFTCMTIAEWLSRTKRCSTPGSACAQEKYGSALLDIFIRSAKLHVY